MDTLDRKVVKDKVRNCSRKEQKEVVREALQASSVSGFDKVLRVRSKVTPLALEPCWLLGTATSPPDLLCVPLRCYLFCPDPSPDATSLLHEHPMNYLRLFLSGFLCSFPMRHPPQDQYKLTCASHTSLPWLPFPGGWPGNMPCSLIRSCP